MTLYYKILCGYNSEREVSITAEELEKAYGLFLLGGRSIFSGGAVDGKLIHMIVPDWHRIMGWTPEHRMGVDDWNQLRDDGVDRPARALLQTTQERVQYFIRENKPQLIGTGAEVPGLEAPEYGRGGGMKKIGNGQQ